MVAPFNDEFLALHSHSYQQVWPGGLRNPLTDGGEYGLCQGSMVDLLLEHFALGDNLIEDIAANLEVLGCQTAGIQESCIHANPAGLSERVNRVTPKIPALVRKRIHHLR
jgi:hypothetical protein